MLGVGMAFSRSGRRVASRGARLAITIIALAALAPFIYFYWITHISDGELTEKPVWVMLQGLAMDDSTNAQPGPLLHPDRDYGLLALGVPGRGPAIDDQGTVPSSTRMWLVLNDHSASRTLRQIDRWVRAKVRLRDWARGPGSLCGRLCHCLFADDLPLNGSVRAVRLRPGRPGRGTARRRSPARAAARSARPGSA